MGTSAATGLPLEWDQTSGIVWKTALPGAGASSPITYGDRVYITCYAGYLVPGEAGADLEQLKRHLIAIRLSDGQVVWDRAVPAKLPEERRIRDHGFAASSVAVDQERRQPTAHPLGQVPQLRGAGLTCARRRFRLRGRCHEPASGGASVMMFPARMGGAILLACLLPAGTCQARTLYVAGSGDDAVAYADNTRGRPWRTIGRAAWGSTSRSSPDAAQAAQAGDTILVSAGVYWENGDPRGGRFTVSLDPVNSGAAGAPTTFRGEGLVHIRMNAGYRGGMIGSQGRDFVIWDHFQIDDYYGGGTSENTMIVNNIFYRSHPGEAQFTPQGNELRGVGVYNNIFFEGDTVIYTWSGANPGAQGIDFDRNLYAGYRVFANLEDSFGRQTFEQWRSRFGLDFNSLNNVAPLLVDPANGNYRLQPGSPAPALGRDVLNLTGQGMDAVIPAGAYIGGDEVIGPVAKPAAATGMCVW